MQYTIENDRLSVSIDTAGAQLISVKSSDGTEYLWQRDAKYWRSSSPVLFPFIARLYKGAYTCLGKKFEMGIHGFAAHCEFTAENISKDSVTMVLQENEETLSQYPFCFNLSITYALSGSALSVKYTVVNRSDEIMPFAIGGHPGFNVPFCPETSFEDYYLCFEEECMPDRIGFSDELFISGENRQYPLENNRIIRLNHSLFDNDAIILQNMARSVSLCCIKSGRKLTVSCPKMPYLGFWHKPNTDAPYVCIEPWSSLPARQGIVEEFTCKSDMIMLNPGDTYENEWSVTFSGE